MVLCLRASLIIRSLCALSFVCFFLIAAAGASDDPFTYPSNWGMTGLMEIPTARVMREDSYRLGVSQIHPYRYYYGAMSPLPGLEVQAQVTQILGVRALSDDYGDYKDKALNIKYQFLPETKYLPALALVINDPQGTRIYASQSIVASKQLYPFDFTIGFGNGRYGARPLPESDTFKAEIFSDPSGWLKDSRVFGGIQFAPSPKFALMMEYSSIKYEKQTRDPAQPKYFQNPVSSQFNFGARWKPFTWAELDLTYQRGNEFGLNASVNFDIGNPLIPIYYRPYREKPVDRFQPLKERVAIALATLGFSDIGVLVKDDELWIRVENDRYFYSTKAVGVILEALDEIMMPSIRKYRIVLTEIGLPLFQFEALRQDALDLHADKLTLNQFYQASTIRTDLTDAFEAPIRNRNLVGWGWKPSLVTFLNDPSGYFGYALGIEGWGTVRPWTGATFVAGLATFPVNKISTSNQPLSIPVRSDIVPYLEQNTALNRLMFEQMGKATDNIYWRGALGYLEIEYAGLDGEVAAPLYDGQLMVGLGSSLVKKRKPNSALGILGPGDADYTIKNYYYTGFLNARLNLPGPDIALDVKGGRFLAGDWGARVTVSKFIKGVTVYAWYSFTNTSIFSDPYNRGYHDKGIGVTIPMRLFEGTDSRTVFGYALAPWTRDVAQDIAHFNSLFDFMGRSTKTFLYKDRGMLQ